jgi:5-methylcytosine-specific restriction protein B
VAPNTSRIRVGGQKVYESLAHLRSALGYYRRFRESNGGVASRLDRPALESLKREFLNCFPRFVEVGGFQAEEGAYWGTFRKDQQPLIDQATEALRSVGDNRVLGAQLLDIVRSSPLLHSASRMDLFRRAGGGRMEEAAAKLALSTELPAVAAAAFVTDTWPIMGEAYTKDQPYRDSRTIPSVLLALVHPEAAIGIRYDPFHLAAKALLGKPVFTNNPMTAGEYQGALDMAEAIRAVMEDEWRWHPRDLWDVQGFIVATCTRELVAGTAEKPGNLMQPANPESSPRPVNLILYGPPGTGKTHQTAVEAVRLCDGVAPDDRDELMRRYRELLAAKRIAFVTFHQSYAYEDFVEGLRPVAEGDDDDAERSGKAAGFSLKPQDGVFKQIADLARENRGRPMASPTAIVDRTRKAFKMSLGRSWAAEDDRIFQDAIAGGYVVLGWGGDVDWSDPRYDDFAEIKARWRQDHPDAQGNDPNISQVYALRANMEIGSLVVISDGNRKFRAMGEITGPYHFEPGPDGEYNHRRRVRWLWRGEDSLARELIYGKTFSQVSVYQLNGRFIDWDALAQIVAGGGARLHQPRGSRSLLCLLLTRSTVPTSQKSSANSSP